MHPVANARNSTPCARGFSGFANVRRRNDWMRMTSSPDRRRDAPEYNGAEAQDEDGGWEHEEPARLADAAQIYEGQNQQNAQA